MRDPRNGTIEMSFYTQSSDADRLIHFAERHGFTTSEFLRELINSGLRTRALPELLPIRRPGRPRKVAP